MLYIGIAMSDTTLSLGLVLCVTKFQVFYQSE